MCSLNCNEVDEKTKTTIRELLPKLRAEIQKECTGKNTDGENNEKMKPQVQEKLNRMIINDWEILTTNWKAT